MTTVMLSCINTGWLSGGGLTVILPLAFAYGGLIQMIAGVMEFRTGNTFGMVAFLSYGAFWWWFCLMLFLSNNHMLDLSKAGPTINWALIAWGVFTLYMWIPTFKLNNALWWIFLTLWITFFLLGFGGLSGIKAISLAGGYLGVVCGLIACYTSFATVMNETHNKTVIPVGPRS